FYTAPPLKLNYRGLGELTVAAELNVLWPVVAVVLQVGHVPAMLLAILAPTAVLQVARMMIMNLGDRVSDSSVGKRTLPVIIGYRPAVAVIIGAQLVAYAMLTLFAYVSWVPWTVWAAMAATAPLSAWLAAQLWGGRMRDVNPEAMTPVVFWASNHVSLIVGAAMLGVLVDAIQGGAQTSGLVILSCVLGAYGLLFGQRLWLAHARALVGAETGAGAPSSGAAPAPADAAFVDPDAAADLDTAADTHPPEAMSAPEEGPAGDPAASGVSASGETPSGDTANDRKPPAAPRQRSRTGGSADQRRASKSGA
ncbi:MAG: prenyltransferase, partial [Micromonosporaceae bacterium]